MFEELRKRPLGRPRRRGNDNCKMDLLRYFGLALTGMAADTVRW
jgi:hypothetical protein